MFQWAITLSDRQVMMLMAFHSAKPDEEGNQFSAVHAMIADAWDVRAVRKLQEQNLLNVEEYTRSNGLKTNRWTITDKGRCICLAIEADTEVLRQLSLRQGLVGRSAITRLDIGKKKRVVKP